MTMVADYEDHVEFDAVITDKWGNTETVYAGSQPQWVVDARALGPWKKMMRANLLDDRTLDQGGWRIRFVPRKENQ